MTSSFHVSTSYINLQYISRKLNESNNNLEDKYLLFIKLVKYYRDHKDCTNEDDSYYFIEHLINEFKECLVNRNVTDDFLNYISEYNGMFSSNTLDILLKINNLPYNLKIELLDTILNFDYCFY